MMHHNVTVQASEPVCVQAIKLYAKQITKQTHYSIKVKKLPETEDVEFVIGTPAIMSLCIEWAYIKTAEPSHVNWRNSTDDFEDNAEDSDLLMEVVRHYTEMFKTLAKNVDASRALLKHKMCDQGVVRVSCGKMSKNY